MELDRMPRRWQLQEAKARFSELVDCALAGEPQVVTRRGHPAVVVIPYEDYKQLNADTMSAWDIFKTAPRMDEEDLPIERDTTVVRPIDLT
jgi:prevent-host-death family protein